MSKIAGLFAAVMMLRRRLSALACDQRGVSAVEFALVLPLMVTLYLGGVEVSQGLTIDRKVTLVARTVADLAAQTDQISSTQMTDILAAATTVLTPFPASSLNVTVSQVAVDANGNATISWSQSNTGAGRAAGSTVALPSALATPNTYLIWGEASYAYKPVIGYVISGTLTLSDQIYMRPRLSDSVQYPSS